MENYEKEINENLKRNTVFIKEFEKWLKSQKLTAKTIRNHLSNIDLYLNDYLSYYEVTKMEKGVSRAYTFFNDWFIRKCAFATMTSIKEIAASVKKFYKCMLENKHISNDDYDFLYRSITDNMDEFFDSLDEFDNMDDEEWY